MQPKASESVSAFHQSFKVRIYNDNLSKQTCAQLATFSWSMVTIKISTLKRVRLRGLIDSLRKAAAEYLSRLKVGASLQELQLMTCDCLSCGLSHPHSTERGNRKKELQLPVPGRADERVETRGGKERESSFVSVSRDVCGRDFLTDRRSLRLEALLCGCGQTGRRRLSSAGTMRHLSSSVTLCLIGCLITGNAVCSFAVLRLNAAVCLLVLTAHEGALR